MSDFEAIFLFFAFFIFAILADNLKQKQRKNVLAIVCIILAIMAGTRDYYAWNDTLVYVTSFNQNNNIFSLTELNSPYGYSEMGFFYLSAFIKLFTDNATVYLTIISALTFVFLYKSFDKYSIYPLFGIVVYVARFYCGRNMMQIRACLAIAIIIYFTFLIKDKKWWKYLLVIAISYTLHRSSIIALPILLLKDFRIKPYYIYSGIIVSLLIGQFGGNVIKQYVETSDFAQDMAGSYIQEGSNKAFSNDLTNPVIWYQIFILIAFTFYEERLKPLSNYYHIFRNGYFYSTCILIILCQYAVVAARSSTIFATFEVAMVPMLLFMFGKKERGALYVVFGLAYIYLFYMNYNPHYAKAF